ncbi:MAG: hypothetical protein KKG84_03345, partial [Candidatus Omnitrophica bacterium]|nr:hypothetical protein [Candidatus Omnitrophota bacterium]
CRYGYPRHMAIGWAKTIDRIIKMSDVVGDMVSVSCSLQTLDAEVMKNVKRTNISFDEFKRAQRYFNSKGVSTHTEIILALPGETRETHMKGLKDLFDYGTASMQCYNLRMLGGSRLNAAKNRKKYGLKTKYRLVDGCFGKYEDIISIESEEMVVGTDTMTMDDILYFRPIHFLIQFFWNYKYYKELLHFLGSKDINAVDFIVKVIANMGSASPAVKGIFDDFMKEARDEWFDTEEELFEHYSGPENFKMICEGGFGKLNFKYTYRFLLECKNECDEYVFATAAELLDERKKLDEISKQQMEDLLRYIKNRFIDLATVSGSPRYRTSLDFKYDIFGWKNRACIGPIPAAAGSGVKLSFILPNEQATALRKLYKQFKSDNINQTLRKMVECIMNKDELFYKVDYASNLEGK